MSFLFSCYAPTRDLHSFPTRRSSDLRVVGLHDGDYVQAIECHSLPTSLPHRPNHDGFFAAEAHFAISEAGAGRSEEHTSELQSLTNLVCRLLLEKKNHVQTTDMYRAG